MREGLKRRILFYVIIPVIATVILAIAIYVASGFSVSNAGPFFHFPFGIFLWVLIFLATVFFSTWIPYHEDYMWRGKPKQVVLASSLMLSGIVTGLSSFLIEISLNISHELCAVISIVTFVVLTIVIYHISLPVYLRSHKK